MKEELEIVVIEDNEDDAERIIRFLKSHISNKITHIEDGAEAVKFLLLERTSAPKLILLDLVLPSVDGIELFNIIKAEPRERNISVVFLVTSQQSKDYLESMGLHPDGYLKKPSRVESMIPMRLE